MTFRPLHDRVVVRRIEAEEKTRGGIIIPDTAKESPRRVKSSPSAPGPAMRAASSLPSTCRPVIACSSASGPAPRCASMARISSS